MKYFVFILKNVILFSIYYISHKQPNRNCSGNMQIPVLHTNSQHRGTTYNLSGAIQLIGKYIIGCVDANTSGVSVYFV